MIQLHTLGRFDLLDRTDGHQILSVLAQPKRVGFLTYLAMLSPRGPHQRDTLLGVFWPDSTEKKARNALNQTVFVLRRALGQRLFTMNGEPRIGIDPDHFSCDVWDFEAALASGEKEEALNLYQGNFLEGFFLPGCSEFERWVDAERGRLRDLARGAALSLSREMESAGNPVGAIGWLRRAREWAPFDELVLRRQMDLLLALGDRSGAVREYESFARRLSVDLGMEPSKETRLLLDKPATPTRTWSSTDSREESVLSLPAGDENSMFGRTSRRFPSPRALALAILFGAIGAGSTLMVQRSWTGVKPTLGPTKMQSESRENVVVLPLENATGDPGLDPVGRDLAEEITQELATTGLASVTPGSPRGLASPDHTDSWVGNGADYLVSGNYSVWDGRLVFRARILDGATGSIVVAVDTVMGTSASTVEATKRLSQRVAGAMAMALDPEMSDLTTVASHPPSFEAYQLLSNGREILRRASAEGGSETRIVRRDSAAQMFLEAADRDSGFNLPLIFLLEAGPTAEYQEQLRALRARRDHLPPFERAMLDYHLAWESNDYSAQHDAMLTVVRVAPSSGRKLRLAIASAQSNRPREALRILSELESDWEFLNKSSNYWMYLTDVKLLLEDYDGVLTDIERSRVFFGQDDSLGRTEVEALARLGRFEEATNRSIELLQSTGHLGTRFWQYHLPRVLRAAGSEEWAMRLAEVGVESFSRIDGERPSYAAAALVNAGRYDEARDLLARAGDSVAMPVMDYTLKAYMAAREGKAEEAIRLAEMAARVNEANGFGRGPYGVMSQVEVAAHLGDNAGAVRFLREAYGLGLPHGSYIFTRWDLRPLEGYQPFEDMMRPKG